MLNILMDNPRRSYNQINTMVVGVKFHTFPNYKFTQGRIQSFLDATKIDCMHVIQNNLARKFHKFNLHTSAQQLTPSTEHLKFGDKQYFHEWMCSQGMQQYLPLPGPGQFPIIVKHGSDRGGRAVKLVQEQSALDACYDHSKYVIQRAIPGHEEYVVHIVAKHGVLKHIVAFCYDFANQITSQYFILGTALRPKSIETITPSDALIEPIKTIIAASRYHGIANFDIKIFQGKPYILEMNTHLGAGLIRFDTQHQQLLPFLLAARSHLN